MKPHLLYLAFWYPPSRASGVYRALATTNAFIEAGWDLTVVTTSREFLEDEVGSIDPSLLRYVPSSVEVIRVPFAFDMLQAIDIRSLGWLRANFPNLWQRARQRLTRFRRVTSTLSGTTAEAHAMTDRYVSWIDPVVKAGLARNKVRTVDHVLATGNPYASFEAARLLGSLLDVAFSIDFRDPWTIDVFSGRVDAADRATTEAEATILSEATHIFHVNEAIADAYRAKYPETHSKHHVVYNGFDPESVPPPSGPAAGAIRFGVLGTLNENWPIDAIFDAWAVVRHELPESSTLVLGGHLGYFERSRDVLETYLPDDSTGFSYIGPVAKADVADFYESVDVLVLPVPGGPLVTSGKVFEALAVGKPVVCVQATGGGARTLTNRWPMTFGADPDRDAVRRAMLAAAAAARDLDVDSSRAAQEMARQYERSRTIQIMVDQIEKSFASKSGA